MLAAALLLSHRVFEFWMCFGGVAATLVYRGAELSSVSPAAVLSAAQLGFWGPFRTRDWQ